MSEITNVMYSEYMTELKTGAWKKQLNEMSDGKYMVEIYWLAWIYESERAEAYLKYFEKQREAEEFYQNLKTIRQARNTMTRS